MSEFKLNQLHPALVPYGKALYAAIRRADPAAVVTSVGRTRSDQERLYARWKAGLSRYPVAVPGTSKHERGLAFDISAHPAVLEAAGRAWESIGGRWGGRFNDPIHFEV